MHFDLNSTGSPSAPPSSTPSSASSSFLTTSFSFTRLVPSSLASSPSVRRDPCTSRLPPPGHSPTIRVTPLPPLTSIAGFSFPPPEVDVGLTVPLVPWPSPPASDLCPSSLVDTAARSQSPPSLPSPARPQLPDLSTLTPNTLDIEIENAMENIVVPGVTPAMFNDWESRYPEISEADNFRYEYDSSTAKMIVKCQPIPVHDSLQLYFVNQVGTALASTSKELRRQVKVGSGTSFRGFEGDYDYSSTKLPDAYVQIAGDEFPTVVCEAGWAENLEDLVKDARLWLLGTNFQTKCVILLALSEQAATQEISDGVVDPTQVPNNDEQSIETLIDEHTTTRALSQQILSLHRTQRLSKPLLGCIHGTIHVLLLDEDHALTTSFEAQVLPAPADSDNLSQSFSLSMKTLFGDAPVPQELDSAEDIVFDLGELRAMIKEQIPLTEKDRAIGRAKAMLRRLGKGDTKETYAALKRKRKLGDTWVPGEGSAAKK